MTRAHSLPLLLACFFFSGVAALVYETAWSREFSFVFGTSELAVAMILAAYMGGLALGSAVAGRLVHRVRRPVLVYGILELGIALAAFCVPYAIAATRLIYVWVFGVDGELSDAPAGIGTSIFYAGLSFLILMAPTSMMGATLPLLARHAVVEEREIGSRIGLLYGLNTAGAVVGCLLTPFVLLPALGLRGTIYVAVGLNGLVFAAAWAVSRLVPLAPSLSPLETRRGRKRDPSWILPLMLVSGAVSFSYELVWFRLLVHVVGASVQAFGTMLGAFLAGIALGSSLAARLATTRKRAAAGYALAQLGTALLSWLAFRYVDRVPELVQALAAKEVGSDFVHAAVCMLWLLPATICIGTTFPFAVRLLAVEAEDAGPASARVYAWNTVGSIVGSIGTAFFLLPGLGFAHAMAACIGANLLLAGATSMLFPPRRTRILTAVGIAVVLVVLLPPATPWNVLTATSLEQPDNGRDDPVEYLGVGRSATVLLRDVGMYWQLQTNGLPEAGVTRADAWPNSFPLTRWLTALPVLAQPEARRMLVIGFGAGTALETIPPSVERIDVVELEPEVIEANLQIRDRRWRDPLSDPRVHVHLNDARSALLLTDPQRSRFDAIVSQPSHPWAGGAAHLYTQEFFELVESRLSQGGVFVQWIGTRFIDDELLRSLLAALTQVFGFVEIYQPPPGSSLLFLCANEPIAIGETAARALRDSPEAFATIGLDVPEQVESMRRTDDRAVRILASGARPNRDERNPLQIRSERVEDTSIGRQPELLDEYDPLARMVEGRGHGFFILRQLIPFRLSRLLRVSEDLANPLDRKLVEALVDMTRGKPRSASRKLEEILAESPRHAEARAALLTLSATPLSRGTDPLDLVDAPLGEAEGALIGAWQSQGSESSEHNLEALDPSLAAVEVRHPLWKEAARQRIRWRLARGDEASLREAVAISDALLGPHGEAKDLFLRAQIQAALGRPRVALDAIVHLGRRLVWSDSRSLGYAREAAELIRDAIPDTEEMRTLRTTALLSLVKPGA